MEATRWEEWGGEQFKWSEAEGDRWNCQNRRGKNGSQDLKRIGESRRKAEYSSKHLHLKSSYRNGRE